MKTSPQETLHDCPACGGKNFTAKGLKSHNCARRKAKAQAISVLPPDVRVTLAEIAVILGRMADALAESAANFGGMAGECREINQGLDRLRTAVRPGLPPSTEAPGTLPPEPPASAPPAGGSSPESGPAPEAC